MAHADCIENAPYLNGFIFGHSFVRHLGMTLNEKYNSTQDYAQSLRVHRTVNYISLHGIDGAGVLELSEFYKNERNFVNEDFIIVDIGTEDLIQEESGSKLAETIVNLSLAFLKDTRARVKLVVLSLMVRRTHKLGIHTEDSFERERKNFNDSIKSITSDIEMFRCMRMEGVESVDHCVFSSDGVHLDTEYGKAKYMASIRTAIFNSVGWLKKNGY